MPTQISATGAASHGAEDVDASAVYEQWHEEKRYYRLYQASAFWASTVLLAFAGGAVAYVTASESPVLSLAQRVLLTSAPGFFAIVAAFVVGYAYWRYRQLANQWSGMEPGWKRELDESTVKKHPRILNPTVAEVVLILLLGAVACGTIWGLTAQGR